MISGNWNLLRDEPEINATRQNWKIFSQKYLVASNIMKFEIIYSEITFILNHHVVNV